MTSENSENKTTKTIKSIGLICGYAEDAQIAITVWHVHGGVFKSKEKALDSLAEYHLNVFLDKTRGFYKLRSQLCGQNHSELSTNFCPNCGLKLSYIKPSIDNFEEYIRGLVEQTCDSYGYYDCFIWESYPEYSQFNNTIEIDLLIPEKAEHELSKRAQKMFPDKLADRIY